MSDSPKLGGAFTPTGTPFALRRMGYGTMQLTGPMVWGPPPDRPGAVAVLREAVKLGVNHIDTSDYYGPYVANEILREALDPYRSDLVIVTKVGALRAPDKSWPSALSKQELIDAVHDNLQRLGLEAMDIVNLRVGGVFGPSEGSIAEPLGVLAGLQSQGLIKYLGLSNVSRKQFEEGRAIAKIVCVQNHYNLAERRDDDFIVELATQGVAYVPYFPLGGFRPLKSPILDAAAVATGATTRQIALAWLLQRSPNILTIAGTSSVEHLRENLAAAELRLPPEVVAQLDQIASSTEANPNESGH